MQHGAAGVGEFFSNLSLPESERPLRNIANWIISRVNDGEERIDGLYLGLSGTAWFLLKAGKLLCDEKILKAAEDILHPISPVHHAVPDITHGTAGIGMTNLYFWNETKDSKYLNRSIESANHLTKVYSNTEHGLVWNIQNDADTVMAGRTFYGFAHGNAGICHFLMLMYCVTKEKLYLDVAQKGMDTLLNAAKVENNKAYWGFGPGDEVTWPHWCNGSSGIGSTLIRMYLVCKDEKYLRLADFSANTVMEYKWKSSNVQCHGLAGNGEFLLDMYNFTGDEKYLRMANELVEVILSNRLHSEGYTIFADESGMRISCDFGIGLSGIAAFLNRMIENFDRSFMLDEIMIKETEVNGI